MKTINGRQIYEKTLYYAMLLFAELYLQYSLYQFFLAGSKQILRGLKWYAVALALAAVVYAAFLIAGRKKYPETFAEKKAFLRSFKSYEQCFLVFLFFWYIISAALSQHFFGEYFKAGFFFSGNDTWMFITGLIAFLFFPLARYAGEKNAKATIEILLKTVLIPYAVFTIWFLWQLFHGNYVTFPSGRQIMLEGQNVLTLSTMNHNTLASQAMVMCGIALYMTATQKPMRKVFYSLCIVVFAVFLALTNSRNYWYCTAAMLCLAAVLFCWYRLEAETIIVRLGAAICAAVIVGVFLHWFREEIFVLLNASLTRISETDTAMVRTAAGALNPASYQLRPVAHFAGSYVQTLSSAGETAAAATRSLRDNFSTVGNRLPLYKASLSVMFTDRYCFLFGYTPLMAVEVLRGVHGVSDTYNYTHLHDLFLQMGISYGVPTMVGTVVFSVSIVIRSIRILFSRKKQLFSGAWLVPLLIVCFLASDMVEAELNSSSLLVCAIFYLFAGWTAALDDGSPAEEKKRDKLRACIITAELAVFVALAVWLSPWFMALNRAYDLTTAVRQSKVLFVFLLFGLGLIVLLFWELEQVLETLLQRRKPGKRQAILAGALMLCLIGGLVFANSQINRVVERNVETLEQERPAVEAIRGIPGCHMVVDSDPELYRRVFGVVSRSFDHGNDLAKTQNVAAIADADEEYNALIRSGFLYAEISEKHAVYTNSAEAIEALKAAGYHLTGYYSRTRALDLTAESRVCYLYAAAYRATFDLRLGDAFPEQDDVIATLKVISQENQTALATRDVFFSEFNEAGTCSSELNFSLLKADNVEFVVEPKQDDFLEFKIEAIHYRKNPAYDTHAIYDGSGKRISEAYFDLEGNPVTVTDGSQGKSFIYDDEGNVAEIRYLNAEGEPILNTTGYAVVRRAYNDDGKVIREEYYDAEESPVNIGIGYQALENRYDEEGRLSLTYFYDKDGNSVACGSSYFHEYLTALAKRQNVTVFLAIKDEGTNALTVTLLEDLKKLGIRTDLNGKSRYSYYAVLGPEGTQEELSETQPVTRSGVFDGVECTVSSAGYNAGNYSSVVIGGTEYSQNVRGMNIVVMENGIVTESIAFDTYSQVMAMTGGALS